MQTKTSIITADVHRFTVECDPETRHTVETFDECYSSYYDDCKLFVAIVRGKDENNKEVLEYLKRGRPSKEGYFDVSQLKKGMVIKAGHYVSKYDKPSRSTYKYYLVDSNTKAALVLIDTIDGKNVTYLRAHKYLTDIKTKKREERNKSE